MQTLEFEVVHLVCGGIDVHKKSLAAAVCVTAPVTLEAKYSVKIFNSTNSEISPPHTTGSSHRATTMSVWNPLANTGFPSDDSLLKMLYLVMIDITKK